MPLDPNAKAVLEAMAALNAPPLSTLTPEQARMSFSAMPVPPIATPAARVQDTTVPGPAGDIPVRVYANPGDRGTLVFFHGGGFVLGDIASHDEICHSLAHAAGCSIVSVDYRLAPEHPYPAATEDAYAATAWIAANGAAQLGLDTSRIAVGGDSAGGNLAAVVSLMARDRGGPAIALQFLIYPAVDMAFDYPSFTENGAGYFLDQDTINYFTNHYVPGSSRAGEPYLSPILASSHAGLPPALIQTAEFDPLRDQGPAYGEKLRAAGVEAAVTCYDGMIHGFYNLGFAWPARDRAIAEAATSLRAALGAVAVH
ncbi:MAG: alpha/beta hydrolase [Chloroflexi bacterium]|nr:alpha/beta hydrolase [Chloroflexota bacterium]